MNAALKLSALGGLIAVSIAGLVTQRVSITDLREELVAASRRSETRASHPQRAAQVPQTSPGRKASRSSSEPIAPKAEHRPAADPFPWKDKGNASPESALETAMWAASKGDVDALARLLVFEPKAREVVEALRASLPESSRARFPTDESLVALLLAQQAPLEGMEVVDRSDVAAGGVLLRVAMAGSHGTNKQADFAFVNGSEGWRLVVTSELASHSVHLLRR